MFKTKSISYLVDLKFLSTYVLKQVVKRYMSQAMRKCVLCHMRTTDADQPVHLRSLSA